MATVHLHLFGDEAPLLGFAVVVIFLVVVALQIATATLLTFIKDPTLTTGPTLTQAPTLAKMMGFSAQLLPTVLSLLDAFNVKYAVVMAILRSTASTA